jgi:hypothetical protein
MRWMNGRQFRGWHIANRRQGQRSQSAVQQLLHRDLPHPNYVVSKKAVRFLPWKRALHPACKLRRIRTRMEEHGDAADQQVMTILQYRIIQPQAAGQPGRVVSRLEVEVQQVLRVGMHAQYLIRRPGENR